MVDGVMGGNSLALDTLDEALLFTVVSTLGLPVRRTRLHAVRCPLSVGPYRVHDPSGVVDALTIQWAGSPAHGWATISYRIDSCGRSVSSGHRGHAAILPEALAARSTLP